MRRWSCRHIFDLIITPYSRIPSEVSKTPSDSEHSPHRSFARNSFGIFHTIRFEYINPSSIPIWTGGSGEFTTLKQTILDINASGYKNVNIPLGKPAGGRFMARIHRYLIRMPRRTSCSGTGLLGWKRDSVANTVKGGI